VSTQQLNSRRAAAYGRGLMRQFTFSIVLIASLAGAGTAQDDGCCQYKVRGAGGTERRCMNLSEDACTTLKAVSTFLRGLKCDDRSQRCLQVVPPPTATLTPTGSLTPTRTPTPLPQTQVHGCCQVNDPHRVGGSTCGNDIVEASCLQDFGSATVFCQNCSCSSHPEPGFSRSMGLCVRWTATPTRTPTPTPVRPPIGCCQLDDLRRTGHPVCGNAISQVGCLDDYAGVPSFCLDCVCSSHSGAGFDLAPGACVTRTPTPSPTTTSTPRVGCCELDAFNGGPGSVCGDQVSESSCLSDSRGTPRFCVNCACSSHTGPGITFTSGACQQLRPVRPHGPHIPRGPRAPR